MGADQARRIEPAADGQYRQRTGDEDGCDRNESRDTQHNILQRMIRTTWKPTNTNTLLQLLGGDEDGCDCNDVGGGVSGNRVDRCLKAVCARPN